MNGDPQRRPGPALCARHARQAARDMSQPDGECWPASSWHGGDGSAVTCDAIANPLLVATYVAHIRGAQGPSEAVHKDGNRAAPAGDAGGPTAS